jgi:hypothetical protein
LETIITLGNRHDTQVDIAGQAPVQFDFPAAVVLSFFKCAKVQKARIDRLFDFVDKRPREHYPRNMRFPQADLIDGMGKKVSRLHGPDEFRLVVAQGVLLLLFAMMRAEAILPALFDE